MGWDYAEGYCVQRTFDGGYIAVGATSSPDSTPGEAILLVKLSASGNSQWVRTFKGVGGMRGTSVVQTSDGGFILAGSAAADVSAGHWDPCIVKTDASGNELWRSRLSNNVSANASSVVSVGDTAYTVVADDAGDSGVVLRRTDISGNLRWRHAYNVRYGLGQNDERLSLRRTSDGGYIIGTKTLLKVGSQGENPQLRTFGSVGNANSVIQTSDGGYAVTGTASDDSSIYLLKTNTNLDCVWMRTYLPTEWSRGQWVEQTTDGGYVICGTTRPGNGDDRLTLVRTSSNGDTVWTDTLSADYGYCVQPTTDGGFVVAGTSSGLFVTKLAPDRKR